MGHPQLKRCTRNTVWGTRLLWNPDDENDLVIIVVTGDLPTSGGRKVDTGHNERIVVRPTAAGWLVDQERRGTRVYSFAGNLQF